MTKSGRKARKQRSSGPSPPALVVTRRLVASSRLRRVLFSEQSVCTGSHCSVSRVAHSDTGGADGAPLHGPGFSKWEVSTGSSLKSQLHELLARAACPVRPGTNLLSAVNVPGGGSFPLEACPPPSEAGRNLLSGPSTRHPSGPSAQLAAAQHLLPPGTSSSSRPASRLHTFLPQPPPLSASGWEGVGPGPGVGFGWREPWLCGPLPRARTLSPHQQ